MKHTLSALMVLTLGLVITTKTHAGEVYTGLTTHGVMLGYAQAISPSLTVRGDFATLGKYDKQQAEEGIDYQGKLTYNRSGLFADWYPFKGGFRLTSGVTFNNVKADLQARGNGSAMTIGTATFTTSTDDRLNVRIQFPKTTPYLGIGYGHQMSTGFGFVFDLGASFGKAKVTESHSGTNITNTALVTQADIDAELAELREGVGKVKVLPMFGIGLNYRF